MKKILKIAGIIFGAIVAVAVVLSVVLNSVNSRPGVQKNYSDSWAEAPMSANLSGKSVTGMLMPGSSSETSIDYSNEAVSAPTDKKIIKSGNLNLQVEKVDAAVDKIFQVAKTNGGDVFSSSVRQSKNNVKNGTVTVKIPVANFEKAFSDLKKIATLVINESTSGQDVTEQYADLQSQLKNAQAEEQAYLKILDQAQKIDDVLAVTRQLSVVRGTIEQLQGRIKFMDSQTDMSSITISLTEDTNITVVDSWRPWQVVKEAFNTLIKSLQGLTDSLIKLVVVALPVLLIWTIIIWVVYKIGRKIYLKAKGKRQNNLNQ